MAGNRIASLFAELGFVINRAGLKQFQSELKATAKQINSQQGIVGATGKAQKTTNKFFADMQKNYSKMRPNLGQMKKDLFEVRKAMAGGLGQDEMRQAAELQERISRDIGKEYEKLAKQKARTEKQASDAVSRSIKQRQAMYQREQKGIERAERSKQTAMERTRNKLIQVTRRYSAHDAKLMQIRDSVRAVNKARRDGLITLERAQQEVRQLTNEYRRLQAAQASLSKTTIATGPFSGGKDPRQVGNHRFISALHSDAGLAAMIGGYAAAQSTRAYQNYLAMEQGIGAATGSMEQAAEEMEYLRQLSNEMGLFMGDLGSDYAKFAASARDTSITIDQQRDIFKGVAAQVRILNLSAADSQRIFRALSQMMSTGQIMAQELKLQMGDQLPGAMRAMARAAYRLNITQDDSIASMNKAMEQGLLMSEEILPVFADELWKAANQGGALAEAMQNTGSAIERFRTNFWYANKTFQEAGMDRGVRNLMNTMSDFIMRAEPLWIIFGKVSDAALAALEGPIEFFGMLAEKMGIAIDESGRFTTEFKILTAAIVAAVKPFRRIAAALFLMGLFIPAITDTIDEGFSGWNDFFIKMAIWAGGAFILARGLKAVYDVGKKVRDLFRGGSRGKTPPTSSPKGGSGDAPTPKKTPAWLRTAGSFVKRGALAAYLMTRSEKLGQGRDYFAGQEDRPQIFNPEEWQRQQEEIRLKPGRYEPLLGRGGGMAPGELPFGQPMYNMNGDITINIDGDSPTIKQDVIDTINDMFRTTSTAEPVPEK